MVIYSEDELEELGINNYIAIEEFDLGQKTAFIMIRVEPYFDAFNKKNGKWAMEGGVN